MDRLWALSRQGSNSGRGFHYQDAVATELAVRMWNVQLPIRRIVPEGLDDISVELDTHWLHLQAKSRREHRGEFTLADIAPWSHLAERLRADHTAHVGLVLERPLRGATTGFERTLADVVSPQVRAAVSRAVEADVDPNEFMARTHVLVMPALEATAVAMLSERLNLPPATCHAHYGRLSGSPRV